MCLRNVIVALMPHKHNASRRHHIPKMAFKVQNWPAYEAGLRRRGSLTLWIEDGALENWQASDPGGQVRCSGVAIQTSLMLRLALKLALRQTEGLMASVIELMGLTIDPRLRPNGLAGVDRLLPAFPGGDGDGSRQRPDWRSASCPRLCRAAG